MTWSVKLGIYQVIWYLQKSFVRGVNHVVSIDRNENKNYIHELTKDCRNPLNWIIVIFVLLGIPYVIEMVVKRNWRFVISKNNHSFLYHFIQHQGELLSVKRQTCCKMKLFFVFHFFALTILKHNMINYTFKFLLQSNIQHNI